MHRLDDVIYPQESRAARVRTAGGWCELAVPDVTFGPGFQEIDEALADAADCWNPQLLGCPELIERDDLQGPGTAHGAGHVFHAQPQRAHRCTVQTVIPAGKAVGLAVDHEVDAILAPAGDLLGPMPADRDEAELCEQSFELLRFCFVCRE